MIDYTGVKPNICPKCGKELAAAFVGAAPVVSETHSHPKVRAVVKAKKSRILEGVKPHHVDEVVANKKPSFMNQQDVPDDWKKEMGIEEDDEELNENASPDEVSAYAEELKASIDEASIHVQFEDQPTKFQWFGPKI
jgi:hypothetical protein